MGGGPRRTEPKPFVKLRPASPPRNVANRNRDGPLLADQDHEPLAAGNASVEEVSLQHGIVLGQDRDHHGGILRALALVDGGGVAGTKVSSSPKP
jgi:hypothetical protein